MTMRVGLLGVTALAVATAGASAQTATRRIGAVGAGRDSIVVSASDVGLISAVTFIDQGIAPAIVTPLNARTWLHVADSVEHISAMPNPGDVLNFDPVPLVAVRGAMAYVRTVRSGAAAEHELTSINGGVRTSIDLTRPQFDKFLAYITQAVNVTDSMTTSSGHAASSFAGGSSPGIYFEFQVEQQARPSPDNAPPHFPDMLRSAHVEGSVLAQFVVDTTGLVELSTFKILKSTHPLFTSAVKDALPDMRFSPAIAGGMKVRQLVQMPFNFNLP